MVLPFSEALVDRVSRYTGKSTGPAPIINYQGELVSLLNDIEPEVVSLIFLKSLFDACGAYERLPIQRVSSFIGSRLEDEHRFRYYEGLGCVHLTSRAVKHANRAGSSPHYRSKSTRLVSEKIAEENGLPFYESWSTPKKCGITFYLIEIAKEAGLVTLVKPYVAPNRTQTFLQFTPLLLEHQRLLMDEVEALSFHAWPLIVPPLPWVTTSDESRYNFSGGYHTDLYRTQLPLCRGRHYRTIFSTATTEFLNVLGKTAWCVDRKVFEVSQRCFSDGVTVGSLKAVFDRSMVEKPMPQHLIDLPTDHQLRREWRKTQSELYEQHQKAQRKSIRSREALSLAARYVNHPRFYLSWSCDYRGRAYTQQPFLQPQSTEVEKALIKFADGCRLDESGLRWVERAIGASFIGTKGSFSERESWCQQNLDLIKAVAAAPLETINQWEGASEPWHFLQLCLEYNAVVIERSKVLWEVGLQVDATSSGLQILSGSLLDPIGCLYSNVTSTHQDLPQDAYMQVVKQAHQLARDNPCWAQYVPFLNDRSLGKASLLIALYGGAHGTRTKRVIKSLMSSGLYPEPLGWNDANTIACIIQEASKLTFPQAFKALEWLKRLGRLALKNGCDEFKWLTPTGDTIALRELERDKMVIRTKHLGQLTVATGYSSRLSPKEMLNALAPSYVHSLDATILKAALGDWRHPVACIHDCVAVLPSDMDRMMERLRRAFVFTVSDNPLFRLADDLGVTAEQLPRLPLGTAELSTISPFLFN
jgi:DNA-directed RNA polymerase